MFRRILGLIVALLLTGALLPGASGAQDAPPQVEDDLRAYSIVPPGQDGTVDATLSTGPHYDDQVETYAALINDRSVADGEIGDYFHSMQFGPETIESSYSPTTGVTVYRDDLGRPHIYADSINSATFALGYVTAEDRLWEMDIFRHAAEGNLAELVGPGDNNAFLKMDIDTRRNGYTADEVQKMIDDLDDKYGADGAVVQRGLQDYSDGVNAYIEEVKTTKLDRMPVEYAATGNPPPAFPQEWTPLDTGYVAVLQLRSFGETAGGELGNAAFLSHLRNRLGRAQGTRVYNDLLFQNETRSPITIARRDANFHSQRLGKLDWRSVAIPVDATEMAQREESRAELRRSILGGFGFKAPASNALLISGRESETGNPLQFGAPQVGYATPSFFMDVDVHAPGVDFRGPAVPGASALIPLGRGTDYAWSLTTGYSDAVDTRAELLCEPGGGAPTGDSNGYMFNGDCKAMESREETFVAKPTPTDPQPPGARTETFYRTVHGPVIERGTVKGKPVAFVKERFFWMRELDSIPQFYRWNTQVSSVEDFADAAEDFTMSFNAFYADHSDIGYFHVGIYPRRTRHTSPSLPVWGTGRWEWKGRRPYSRQPHIVNPPQGWVANWNNKPARGWDNYDGFKWGRIQRMQLLSDRLHQSLDGKGKASLAEIVNVIRDATTRDTRGVYLAPRMIALIARSARNVRQVEGLNIVDDWVAQGAHRYNRDGDNKMDDGAALALFDKWYTVMIHLIFDDELGSKGYRLMDAPITDYTPSSGSSFWFDFSSYARNLFSGARKHYARDYCDTRTTKPKETCRRQVHKAFLIALKKLRKSQGDDMSKWSTPAENIEFSELGAGSVDPIPWQNRGTHNQAIEFLRSAGG